MIEMNGKRESGKSVLAAQHDDDDIYMYMSYNSFTTHGKFRKVNHVKI